MHPPIDGINSKGTFSEGQKQADARSEDYITKEKLDAFPVPLNSCLVIYDVNTRKALFFRKTTTGYQQFLMRNKRATPISVRMSDYVFTVDFSKEIFPGDLRNVFCRKD